MTEHSDSEQHPYRIVGYPTLPFSEQQNDDRGESVWVVIELGRSDEDPEVNRVFYDEGAARHHAGRIETESQLPVIVHSTKLE